VTRDASNAPVPIHVIAGPLGVGKTSAVVNYLKRHAGEEFIAVLVNDFGQVGIDSGIIESEGGSGEGRDDLKIFNVPGGCICCTAATGLNSALEQLGQTEGIDRIIIEPSGLAIPSQMIDLLRMVKLPFAFEIRPTITMIDPARVTPDVADKIPYFSKLIESGDVLVANRCDLATRPQVEAFLEWAHTLYPPKLRVLTTTQGELPDEVFETRLPESPTFFTAAADQHDHDHTADYSSGGLHWAADQRFDYDRLIEQITQLVDQPLDGARIERLKGVFQTQRGWRLIEIAQGQVHDRHTDHRAGNRLDWIASGVLTDDAVRTHLEQYLCK